MAKSSSSTKKAAKLAKQGGSRTVRFEGGTVFPLVVAITLILGLGLIVYARQSRPAYDATPPAVNDHWHLAYGFYLCDQWYALRGDLEQRDAAGNLANRDYIRTTIHSHDDGVIHWHPYTTVAIGDRAKLGIFLDNYQVELTDDTLRFPENFTMIDPADPAKVPMPVASEWIEGETQCNGEDAELSVVKWDLWSDLESEGERYIANMDEIRVASDQMAFAIMFAPRDAGKIKPPTYNRLDELGAIDMGVNSPDPGDFLDDGGGPVETLAEASDSTPDDEPSGSAPAGEPSDATVPAETAPGSGPASTTGG